MPGEIIPIQQFKATLTPAARLRAILAQGIPIPGPAGPPGPPGQPRIIQENGVDQTPMWDRLNFVGEEFAIVNNPLNQSIDIHLPNDKVQSVFGRIDDVVAQSGDYSASQVTNAVDQTQSYANPAWIATLDYSKVTNTPSSFPPGPHTHPASDIISGIVNPARLGSGVPDATKYLRGDSTWAPVSGAGGGTVSSVFNRSGDVVAQTGDYNASQVTNAVDQTASYPDPAWITSLDWNKVTNPPSASFYQTPWLQNINADGHTLMNLFRVEMTSPSDALNINFHYKRPDTFGIYQDDAECGIWTDLPQAIAFWLPGGMSAKLTGVGFSIGLTTPQYKLDVAGDCNLSTGSLYKINGVQHTHATADIASGVFPPARLGSGTPTASNFLSGDGTWKATGSGGATDLDYKGGYVAGTYNDGDILIGSDGIAYVCTKNGVTNPPVPWPGGGSASSGASSMTVAAFDAETANGTTNPNGRGLVYLSNGIYQCLWNGTAWEYYHRGQRAYRPNNADFAWINQSSATVDTSSGGIYLLQPGTATQYLAIRKRPAPAAPYTFTAKIIPNLYPVQSMGAGLMIGDGTKIHTYGFTFGSGMAFNIVGEKWTNATTYSAAYASLGYPDIGWQLLWLRMQDDGTNRTCSISMDGINFRTLFLISRTDFLTGTEIGFYSKAQNATEPAGILLASWLVN